MNKNTYNLWGGLSLINNWGVIVDGVMSKGVKNSLDFWEKMDFYYSKTWLML